MATRRLALGGVALLVVLLVLAPSPGEGGGLARHGIVTCDTTVGGVQIVAANPNRVTLRLSNGSGSTIHHGSGVPSALTTGNGIPLLTATIFEFTLREYTGAYRCIAGSSLELRYLEVLD